MVVGPPVHPSGAKIERLSAETARFEHFMLGLRTTAGVDREAFRRRFGQDPLRWRGEQLRDLAAEGWLAIDETSIAPTAAGLWFADELALRVS